MACSAICLLVLLSGACPSEATIKGISYGVSPGENSLPRNDDFFCDEAAPQWSRRGRGDLVIMKAMGANAVRLYGNDPRLNHTGFLDEAHGLGLRAIPGNSDYPFMQSPWSCQGQDYNCSGIVGAFYAENLKKGFLREDGSYHPAISHVSVMNEPDMKLPNVGHPMLFCKALISAMDGMLDTEREAKVDSAGALPNFTVTFSWSLCSACTRLGDKPGLGQMWQLRDAMRNPARYNYTARNNLSELFRTRFVFSFNTANPSFHIRPMFLDFYEVAFPETPVFIGEYHWNNPVGNQSQDILNALSIAQATPLLLGISYFEFQLRTDLGGHLDFGTLQRGPRSVGSMEYFGENFSVRCLVPVRAQNGQSLPAEVARAFGGDAELFETDECLSGAAVENGTGVELTTTTTTTPVASGHIAAHSVNSNPTDSAVLPRATARRAAIHAARGVCAALVVAWVAAN